MSIELPTYLSAVSDAEPAGPNLEDDSAFSDLEASSKGKPEQQFGETVIPGEEPEWRLVKSKALEIAGRSRDLRVGVTLTRALVHTDGAEGLADGLALLAGWLNGLWDAVHPQLDPTDPDPIQRVNTLGALDDFEANLRGVRDIPLVTSRGVGRFSYKDVLVATGKLPPPTGQGDPPSFAAIEAAFEDVSVEEVQKTAADLDRALEAIAAIETAFSSRVGAARGVGLSQIKAMLKSARQTVAEQLEKKSASAGVAADDATGVPAAAGAPRAAPGEVRTRDDAMKALDKICEYFDRHEPSSPVPILLRRAKKLVNKSFMELVRDMASNGVSQVEVFRGSEE